MQPRLARHFFPARPTILGTVLAPFTLWHWLVLEAIESPFVGDDEDSFADLLIAVHVCRHRPGARLKSITPGRVRALWQVARFAHREDEMIRAFDRYVADAGKGPRYFQEGGKTFEVKTSVPLYLVESLVASGRVTRAEALAHSPGAARWLLCTWGECAGHPQNIATPRDEQLARECGIPGYTLDD